MNPETRNLEQLEARAEEQEAEAKRLRERCAKLEKENRDYRRGAFFLLAFFAGALWASLLFDMIEA